ncbi:MAG: envelope stress response membrane protein PspB [Telmatospirillum sp.]|nr:envelope stress response membrane protein PspB [Telmatospirillum sp.]
MGLSGHATGVLIVAIVVLGPMWLRCHYRSRRPDLSQDSDVMRKLDELTDLASRLQRRIETLEGLLDAASAERRHEP